MNKINFTHNLPKVKLVHNRESLIVDYCKNKNVLHLGCVQSGLTIESFRDNSLLHLKIMKVAKRVIGVDIDRNGLNFLSSQGVQDLVYCDIQNLGDLILDVPIDIVVAGEVLEHLPNPGLFLSGISKFFNKSDHEILLLMTVPNAFSLRHFMSVFLNKKELVMPDHTCYLSYVTIKALFDRYELNLINFYTYCNLNNSASLPKRLIKKIINHTLLKFAPFSAEGLIAVAGKKDIPM
jgi:hypothetical protein